MFDLLALNKLGSADIVFFIVLAAIIVLCIGVYFLIPVINKKQYKELRDNLKKRELAFKSNVRRTDGTTTVASDLPVASDEQEPDAFDDTPADSTNDEEK